MEMKVCKCGGTPEIVKVFPRNRQDCFVRCPDCGSETKCYTSRQNAVKAWNKGRMDPALGGNDRSRYVLLGKLIDRIEDTTWYHVSPRGELVEGANSETDIPLYKAEDIKCVISDTPTADVVKVVRCWNCGYYDKKKYVCVGIPTEPVVIRDPNDFCSRGVRRDQK